MELLRELQERNDPVLLQAAASAIGPVAPKADVFGTVDSFFVDYSDPAVLTVYMVSVGRAIRLQYRDTTTWLITCLGLDRVRRVSHQATPTNTTVIIELDADRVTFAATGQLSNSSGEGGDKASVIGLSGNMFPAGWVIEVADPKMRQRADAFAARLRAAVAS